MRSCILLLLWPLFALGTAIRALDEALAGSTRAAADPDKETPPRGWPAMPVEIKPAEPLCPVCDRTIADDDTVAECHGIIWHARCYLGRPDHG